MQPPDASTAPRQLRGLRVLGWVVAAHAVVAATALTANATAAGDTAHQIAIWCGLG